MKFLILSAAIVSAGLLIGASPQAPPRTMALVFTTGPGWDASKAPNAQAHFGTHSANLRRLKEAGVIVAGGRFGAYGLILVRAPSVDSARAMLAADSSVVVGTFKVEVAPWSTIYEGNITR
jgi:uncharacterized protein YciI